MIVEGGGRYTRLASQAGLLIVSTEESAFNGSKSMLGGAGRRLVGAKIARDTNNGSRRFRARVQMHHIGGYHGSYLVWVGGVTRRRTHVA